MAKQTVFLPYGLVKCILLVYWTGVNMITYENLSGVPLNISSSVVLLQGENTFDLHIIFISLNLRQEN